MRVIQPQMQALNEKYPDPEDAMKKQNAMMELYSKAGVNPMGGCLPMLLQMPILVAMFSFFPSSIELRGESFLWAKDLSSYDAIVEWDTYIPLISSTFGNHISLFCLLMTITNILYTKVTMDQSGQNTMPGMKWMMYLMPLMFLFFFNNYASGLSYYYFLSLLITIIQTWAFRKLVDEKKVLAQMEANAKKPRKKSGFMARLEEAQRQQQAMLREQQKQQAKKGKH
jgi:YidC/Oxa1 family membrane protein insertase